MHLKIFSWPTVVFKILELFYFSIMITVHLHVSRKSHEICTQTETGTLSGSQAHRGAEQIQDSEDHSGDNADQEDLLEARHFAGDNDHGKGNSNTFQEIFQGSGHQFSKRKSVHLIFRVAKINVDCSIFKILNICV